MGDNNVITKEQYIIDKLAKDVAVLSAQKAELEFTLLSYKQQIQELQNELSALNKEETNEDKEN